MDRASLALARGLPAGVPASYRALADHNKVSRSTVHRRPHAEADRSRYLNRYEDTAVVYFLLQMSHPGQPAQMKHIPSIAFLATRIRPRFWYEAA